MTQRTWFLPLLLLTSVAHAAWAESPKMLFDRSQIPTLRTRITSPELAPIWERLLSNAEAYCDPKSPRYADPTDPCPLPEKGEYVGERRHNAILVHHVGRLLTNHMEAIGMAYQLTGREELGRHGAALLLATVKEYPITNPVVSKGFAGGRGDIMRGLAIGYDLLSDQLDHAQREAVAEACAGYLDFFVREFNDPKSWWYEVHNYNGVNGGAAGCLALALSDVYPDRTQGWIAECVKIIGRWLSTGFDQEGAYLEGVTYSGYGLSNAVLFADALARSGRSDLFDHPTFDKLSHFYALSLLPGERVFDARNDSSYSGLNVSLLKLAEAKNSGLYRWLWDTAGSDQSFLRILWENDVVPIDPAAAGVPLAQHFRGRGLCIWRTGWTKHDVMFSIEAGPYYPVTHNQADKGHFTLYGLGERWAIDPGYANEHEPNGRGQTVGHSCVLIDGKGQALSGAGWGTNGVIRQYENNKRYGYALADCTEAYQRNNRGMPGADVEYARRHVFFVYPRGKAPAYAVVMDDIRKDEQPHEFTWQMMIPKHTALSLEEGQATLKPIDASGAAYVDSPFELQESSKPAGRNGQLVLQVELEEPGDYVVWGRVRTEAEQRGSADSFFVQLDDRPRVDWHTLSGSSWAWRMVSAGSDQKPVTFNLESGRHRITLRVREPGAQLDCLLLTRDLKSVPSLPVAWKEPLFIEAESGRVSGAMRVVSAEAAAPRMTVHLDAASKPVLSTDVFEPEDYHGPAVFPRLKATVQDVNPRFLAVLLPLPVGVQQPDIHFDSIEKGRQVKIAWPDHVDLFECFDEDGSARMVERP